VSTSGAGVNVILEFPVRRIEKPKVESKEFVMQRTGARNTEDAEFSQRSRRIRGGSAARAGKMPTVQKWRMGGEPPPHFFVSVDCKGTLSPMNLEVFILRGLQAHFSEVFILKVVES
jgi:hypothetical protein